MRFSIVLVLLALFAPIFAVPVPSGRGAGKGGNNGQSGSGVKVKKATPPPAAAPGPKTPANPGDLVKVHGKDYIEGAHTTQTRTHPAIVVHHEPDTHHVHVAVLSHNHPGNPPTISSHALGMTGDETLINLGKPKVVHQNNLKPLGPPAPGKVGLPEKLDPHQLTQLHQELGECINERMQAAQNG